MPASQARADAACVVCGATEHLEPDPNHRQISYCANCLQRAGRHKRIIKAGFNEEVPGY